jgi:hypothetical protein
MNFGYGAAFSGTFVSGVQNEDCKKNTWVSTTAVTCDFGPEGVGKAMRFSTRFEGVGGTGADVFSYDSPVLTKISPSNGPTTGGAPISVFGTNFGTAATAVTLAAMMGTGTDVLPSASVGWLSNNKVVAYSAHGISSNNDVSIGVTPGSYAGTLQSVFSFDAPVVTFLVLPNSPTRGGAVLTLTGTNFGSNFVKTNTPKVTVSGANCNSAAFISSTAVTCLAPPGEGQQKDVELTVGTGTGVLYGGFNYDARIVSPPDGATYYVVVGEQLKIDIVATAEDTTSAIVIKSNEGATAPSYTGKRTSLVPPISRTFPFERPPGRTHSRSCRAIVAWHAGLRVKCCGRILARDQANEREFEESVGVVHLVAVGRLD